MVSRLLLVYAVVELAAIFALVWTIGWGWTLLTLLVTFVLGWGFLAPMAGSQLKPAMLRHFLASALHEALAHCPTSPRCADPQAPLFPQR